MHSSWLRLIERMPIISDLDSERRRSGELAHFCRDWDFILIDETDPEFECCTCYATPEGAAYSAFWAAKRIQENRAAAFDRCWRD
jgi:hypothetical protein